jgi:hypothetical protein
MYHSKIVKMHMNQFYVKPIEGLILNGNPIAQWFECSNYTLTNTQMINTVTSNALAFLTVVIPIFFLSHVLMWHSMTNFD